MLEKTVMQNNLIFKGKFRDVCLELRRMSQKYRTLAEYIKAHLN